MRSCDRYLCTPVLRTNLVMKQNVKALLRHRGLTQKDLADYCHRSESWIGKILDLTSDRKFPLKYWEKISDMLRVETYQLIQPGLTLPTERRKGQRRTGTDRRQQMIQQSVRDALSTMTITERDVALLMRVKLLDAEGQAQVLRSLEALPRPRTRGTRKLTTPDPSESSAPSSSTLREIPPRGTGRR